MNTTNYLNLIFSGYFKNPNTLKRYLIRNQKIEERDNFITEDEFYDNCKDVVLKLKEDIYFQYNNRKSELLEVLDLKKHKGIDTIETQKQYDTNDLSHFTINLYSITNQKIKAYLSYSDIEFVENTINQLVQKDEHNEPQQKETKNPNEVKKELHNNIFKGNTFLLWFKYYQNKNIDVTCKTDLRVIYELMKKDNCFQNTIELKHYINWLNSEFFDGAIMELKKQYFDSRPNQQRLKDYEHYKTNLQLTFK